MSVALPIDRIYRIACLASAARQLGIACRKRIDGDITIIEWFDPLTGQILTTTGAPDSQIAFELACEELARYLNIPKTPE